VARYIFRSETIKPFKSGQPAIRSTRANASGSITTTIGANFATSPYLKTIPNIKPLG